jgi:hypothetical protein
MTINGEMEMMLVEGIVVWSEVGLKCQYFPEGTD